MKLKFQALAAAAGATLLASTAHANFAFADTTSKGNSSAVFVAMDNAQNISVAVDLNAYMADFLPSVTGINPNAGSLSAAGTTAVWNFASNTFTVNGAAVAGNVNWSSPVASFFSNAAVTGNGYQWGVVAGDSANGPISANNIVTGQNLLFTGASVDFNNQFQTGGISTGHISNATGNISQFVATNNNTGTNTATVHGASTATAGTPFLGTTLAANGLGDFSGGSFGDNNFLVDPGTVSYFTWANSTLPPTVLSLGADTTVGSLSSSAASWTWDGATQTLTYSVPSVPEPGTYAMLLAGLASLGFMGRRRAGR